ncbi:MAG: hypothetical protein ACK4SS_04905 [Cypionkella sp.]
MAPNPPVANARARSTLRCDTAQAGGLHGHRGFQFQLIDTIERWLHLNAAGIPAGVRDEKGQFPEGTLHARVLARLKELAARLEKGGEEKPQPKSGANQSEK